VGGIRTQPSVASRVKALLLVVLSYGIWHLTHALLPDAYAVPAAVVLIAALIGSALWWWGREAPRRRGRRLPKA
jgi:hypothetical protein